MFPTWYTGLNDQIAPYIGPGKALDPEKYFIVIPDMFTNGSSSSPSNSAEPHRGLNFPLVTAFDNVQAQRQLLEDHFNITSVEMMVGFSMSGQQAYHWAALHSDIVKRACSICGTARTSHIIGRCCMPINRPWKLQKIGWRRTAVLGIQRSWQFLPALGLRWHVQDWYRHGLHLNDDVKGVSDVIDNQRLVPTMGPS